MIYLMLGAFIVSVLAAFWMARLLGNAHAYKPALMIVLMATLGWCMPLFIQVFLLAGFITIAVQYWEEVKAPFAVWIVAVGTTVAIGHTTGEQDITKLIESANAPGAVQTSEPGDTPTTATTP